MLRLGKSELLVSQMCLGCLYLGSRESMDDSFRKLDIYADAGGNFIDTANLYGYWFSEAKKGGESETAIGNWLKERKNRSKIVLATKVGFDYPGVDYGTSAKQIRKECEKSLRRLGTDYIDLYYAHTDDRRTPMEETLGALNDLVREGKIRYIGASNFSAWRLERASWISRKNKWAEYCCIQQRYSYLRPKTGWDFGHQVAVNEDLIDFIKDTGMALLAYSVLLNGAYTDAGKALPEQYAGPDSEARLKALDGVAEETGATRNQLVYYWLMNADPPSIPLLAFSTKEQFNEAMGTFKIKLSEEQMKRLTEARV